MNASAAKSAIARTTRKIVRNVLIAAAIAIPLRVCVAQPFRVQTDAVAPEVPKGSLVIVYKLTSEFQPGDIIAYREDSHVMLGRVESISQQDVQVSRRSDTFSIPHCGIAGKVIAATR